jgi:hypothetical protein
MEIGRKIYYDTETGTILWDKGELTGFVHETTIEEDYPNGIPTNLGVIQLAYGERSTEFRDFGSMRVINGQLVVYPRLSIETEFTTIPADGVTVTRIAALVADSTYTGVIHFSVDGEQWFPVNANNGVAIFEFASEIAGNYTILARNDLYGVNGIGVGVE